MVNGWLILKGIAAVFGGPTTEICNNSNKHIFLIPISCPDGYQARTSGKVVDDEELAKVIQPRASIKVDSRKYDYSGRKTNSQIYILFRVGDHNNVNKFLIDLRKKNPDGVIVKQWERLFVHGELPFLGQLSLKCNEAWQVIPEVNNADQVDAAETQNLSEQLELIKQMLDNQENLKGEVKALQVGMKTLNEKIEKLTGQTGKEATHVEMP